MSKALHAIERTSPKGPGQKFVGTCMRCGKTGLTFANLNEECENIAGMTDDEALLNAIAGPTSQADTEETTR